jgi:hypothetical protein
MVQAQTTNETLFRKWQQLKISKTVGHEELQNQGYSAEEIPSILEEYTRYRIARRNTMGWSMMCLGGFLGLLSCVLTMVDPIPDIRGVFMYGFTTVAVTMAMYGCYLVMEKANDE